MYNYDRCITMTDIGEGSLAFPPEMRNRDVQRLMICACILTVKIATRRGDVNASLGTGSLMDSTRCSLKNSCALIQESGVDPGVESRGTLLILTSKHLVRNSEDAENSTVELFDFFGDSGTSVQGSDVIPSPHLWDSTCVLVCEGVNLCTQCNHHWALEYETDSWPGSLGAPVITFERHNGNTRLRIWLHLGENKAKRCKISPVKIH
ncbi:hypothetical protein Btru_024587 [Bulinus truncatus]|nr:hypothetical protein Btru_024587 [Bulinus truncatus]